MDLTGLPHLRKVIEDARLKNLIPTAIFFSEKLVSMNSDSLEDVYVLCQLLYQNREYKRVLHEIKSREATSMDLRFKLLLAQCYAACKDWEKCLTTLGEEELAENCCTKMQTEDSEADGIEITAAISLMRGRASDALQNRIRAAFWYKDALKRDVRCYEAFDQLVGSHMLTIAEETELLQSLRFQQEDQWLFELYKTKLSKYDNNALCLDEEEVLDVHMATAHAQMLFYRNDFPECYVLSQRILEVHPHTMDILPLFISTLVHLRKASELFSLSHRLVDEHPQKAVSWFGVGSYYLVTNKLEAAKKYFHKANNVDPYFAPAWLGLGHTLSLQDESDQAMAAYRTAARFFNGCHLPALCIAMEYLRTNNLQLADLFFQQSIKICANDPLLHHEIGVLHYRNEEYQKAAEYFEKALELAMDTSSETWEPTLFNLGHCHRKMRNYCEALQYYELAIGIIPQSASTYAAIAFTYHLKGHIDKAIDNYHKALGLNADDTFSNDMLARALEDACSG